MMNISRNNWNIQEVDANKKINENYTTINRAFNFPIQAFWLREKFTNVNILIKQTFIGLDTVLYISCLDKKITLFCLSDYFFVFDYCRKKTIFSSELITPCVDIMYINNYAYILCESEIIKYSIIENTIISIFNLPDSIKNIMMDNNEVFVILYDGEVIKVNDLN